MPDEKSMEKLDSILQQIGELTGQEQIAVFLSLGENLARINQFTLVESLFEILLNDINLPSEEQQLANFSVLLGHLWDMLERRLTVDNFCDQMELEQKVNSGSWAKSIGET